MAGTKLTEEQKNTFVKKVEDEGLVPEGSKDLWNNVWNLDRKYEMARNYYRKAHPNETQKRNTSSKKGNKQTTKKKFNLSRVFKSIQSENPSLTNIDELIEKLNELRLGMEQDLAVSNIMKDNKGKVNLKELISKLTEYDINSQKDRVFFLTKRIQSDNEELKELTKEKK